MRQEEKENGSSISFPILHREPAFSWLPMREDEKEKGFSSSLPILLMEVCFLLASNGTGGEGERFLFFSPHSSNGSLLSLGIQ